MKFDNLHQILRSLYEQMMPLCGDMAGVAKGIAGLGAGGAMVFFWKLVLKPLGGMFGIYELLPAFVFSVIVILPIS